MKITAVTCVKNEGPFLLEWIAFHCLLGVTDFLIYSNDCDDGSDRLLDVLMSHGLVTHLPNPAQGRAYQMEALKDARSQPNVTEADWVWIADVDEFLNIHAGDHTIPALIAACGYPKAISVSYQFFANGGVRRFRDEPVIEQFQYSHGPDIWCAERAIEVKTLVHRDFPLRYFGAHRPFLKASALGDARPHWTDGSGRTVSEKFLTAESQNRIRRFRARGARQHATLNHYALRSAESFLVKTDRGDVNRDNRPFDMTYWRERNDSVWHDRSILRYLPKLKAALLDLMVDSDIASAHQACVAAHRTKIKSLLQNQRNQRLCADLLSAPAVSEAEENLLRRVGMWDATRGSFHAAKTVRRTSYAL